MTSEPKLQITFAILNSHENFDQSIYDIFTKKIDRDITDIVIGNTFFIAQQLD